ncbi:basic helix-loop-helix transcription factor scleraxis-like [Arctopsyche grandis]|uniref:basic helix-loop-helix transcription factor scleraxis-like n=1 Tax=Arctopsyche grandis TaxID=121162 RepID=UPI00406D8AA8
MTMEYFESGQLQQEAPGKQRNQANARERDRTQKDNVVTSKQQEFEKPVFDQQYPMTNRVNSAFAALRSRIPTEPNDRKLSKIEILRLAGSYISHLANRLITGNDDQPCIQSSTDSDNGTRNQVCTFCWSSIKKERTPSMQCKSINFIADDVFY